jgi:phasin family protein
MAGFPEDDDVGSAQSARAPAAAAVMAAATSDGQADASSARDPGELAAFSAGSDADPAAPALETASVELAGAGVWRKAALKATSSPAAIKAAPVKKAATSPAKRSLAAPRSGTADANVEDSIQQSKETKMSSNPDFTQPMNDAANELQNRSKAAYEKSSEMMTEMSDTAKGNVEAVVESGKIFSNGMQELARAYVEDAKSAYEQITADLKEMAAVKSPTELLQLQSKIMRRNFDAVVANTSKNTEKMMKLSNESFAPITARLSVAAEKITKVG